MNIEEERRVIDNYFAHYIDENPDLALAVSRVLNELEKKQVKIDKIKEYAHQEIVHFEEDIKDYIDDYREKNKDIISELKERKEHWKDIERIINDDKELYMDWWKYGLYE